MFDEQVEERSFELGDGAVVFDTQEMRVVSPVTVDVVQGHGKQDHITVLALGRHHDTHIDSVLREIGFTWLVSIIEVILNCKFFYR